MGVEERQCEYCKCVASEYSIEYCDECDKYVCLNKKISLRLYECSRNAF